MKISTFIFLFTFIILLLPFPDSKAAPKGCKILKNGRLSCKIKGIKKTNIPVSSKKSIRETDLYPWKAISKIKKTLSIGSCWHGALHRPEKIKTRGRGYGVLPRTVKRGHDWGTSELIRLVRDISAAVAKAYPGSHLAIGDLSRQTGGFAPGHRSHQSGRDVDLGFYMINKNHKYMRVHDNFPRFNTIARGEGPYKHLIFDLERNWELVEQLLNHHSGVTLIIVDKSIKALLISYAEAVARPPALIAKARRIIRHASWHEDHFHVRIGCPANQPYCK
ncbi:penicillin-insensitive murein endopeptidase [Myxococcota bacterium]|nr:penicillin-insensitive murein endopeptidase [Myxococcota bacterium]MBU1383002.1 penicillin-insensitive murein endopeptidase [Myxococcota bacterium]MBU1498843.1 penicillin-insensitive murein endopeptidase [Myxococcota bacterium]